MPLLFRFSRRARRTADSRRAVALVLVLLFLALVSAFVIAFMATVKSDLSEAKNYAASSSSKQLADSVVQVVMGSIRTATSGGTKTAWASQPGMIRTYDDSGNPKAFYKLYSSDRMVVAPDHMPYDPAAEYDAQWQAKPALFTDLNSPATSSGAAVFPIIDGNEMKRLTLAASGGTSPPYLGYDANGDGKPDVEGFGVDPAKVAYDATQPLTAQNNPVPMPVKWLYILEDGTLTAPTGVDSTGKIANWQGSTQPPTKDNPIKGRVAFWTDDETCKVNVNTASEGVFWDYPRTCADFDWTNLAKFQPAQREFQRYPGHPMMTSLSTIFGSVLPADQTGNVYNYSQFKPYYDLAPKINDQTLANNLGSQAGTAIPPGAKTTSVTPVGVFSLTAKTDRLYSSVDEFLFQPSRAPNSPFASEAGLAALRHSRFFITTSSRAPDVTLFNQPRVISWPVNVNPSTDYRTVFDSTIAFCGTINNFPYYFQRQRNDHPTNDLPATASNTGLGRNRRLIEYLQYVTSQKIPGFGKSFLDKYPAAANGVERDQILTEIFDYIRCLNLCDPSSNPAASFHAFAPVATSAAGYSSGYNTGFYSHNAGLGQVVPIYDSVTKTRGFGRFPTVSEVALMFIATAWNDASDGEPLASDPNNPNPPPRDPVTHLPTPPGYYGLPTVTLQPPPKPPLKVYPSAPKYVDGVNIPAVVPANTVRIQAMLVVNLFDPAQGFLSEAGTYRLQISGLEKFMVNATGMGFPASLPLNKSTTNTPCSSTVVHDSYNYGGNLGFRFLTAFMQPGQPAGSFQFYPFFSNSIDLPYNPGMPAIAGVNPGSFMFSGGPITINILLPANTISSDPNWNASMPVQSITVALKDGSFPCPRYAPLAPSNQDRGRFGSRLGYNTYPWDAGVAIINGSDVVRSVRAYPGDIRLIAARKTLDSTVEGGYFDNLQNYHPEYGMSDVPLVHGLMESGGFPFLGATMGQLVAGLSYQNLPTPAAKYNAYNATQLDSYCTAGGAASNGAMNFGVAGDWDNGFAYTNDGPYINKADEGDFNYYNTTTGSSTYPYYGAIYNRTAATSTFFSPNRLMPSPGMFGSLPTGVMHNQPWMTLQFRPDPAAHPGLTSPRDHLFLDLFNMPVVEPYPITEPLSTAGRINMNYQIAPFSYITRSTGLRSVLKSERITAIPDGAAGVYKGGSGDTNINRTAAYNFRIPINADETLKAFDYYFSSNKDIFRSASQICDMFLYPARDAQTGSASGPLWDSANSAITNFWQSHRLTGDNTRERPYTTIYPRLTTKSNTYTVHMRVQMLKKIHGSSPDTWDEGREGILGEYRGSQTLERYVDPASKDLPDFAADPTQSLDSFYRFRVINTRQFTQ